MTLDDPIALGRVQLGPGSAVVLLRAHAPTNLHTKMVDCDMATQQIAVRLPAPLLLCLDELVESCAYESRAAVVRAGIETIARLERQRRIDSAIVDGYTRLPPTEVEDRAALVSLGEAILDEPW